MHGEALFSAVFRLYSKVQVIPAIAYVALSVRRDIACCFDADNFKSKPNIDKHQIHDIVFFHFEAVVIY
jgi:hypothetical protein